MNDSWIKLFRKFKEWEWYKDNNTKSLFIEILLSANFEDKKWQGIIIHRGEFITSIEELGVAIGLTRQQIRYSLNKLKVTNEVTIQTNKHYTLIKVNKFNNYQEVTNQLTINEPSSNHPVTTTKEYKNIKKEKNNYKEEFNSFLKNFNEKAGGRNYGVLTKRQELFSLRRKIFSLDQLLRATQNLFGNDFYSGNNDRHWSAEPEFLLRTDEQVDKFLNLDVKKQELIKL